MSLTHLTRRLDRPVTHCLSWLWGLALLMLAGCSPTYDWRQVEPEQAPVTVALPAKPAQMTRSINLDGLKVSMEMHGARAGGQSYTVGWVRLPPATAEPGTETPALEPQVLAQQRKKLVQKTLKAMQAGMLNNIAAEPGVAQERTLRLVDSSGQKVGLIPAVFVDVIGSARGTPQRMQALFAALGDDLVQFVVLGETWSDEAAAIFIESAQVRMLAQGQL